MKELSIEQKAKAYDEALERAKKLYEQGTITESLSYVFPEFKESEDERIRKDIIRYIKKTSPAMGENIEHMVAWLEKQEQKPTDEDIKEALRTEYEKGRADAIAEMQNLAWSEEDEEFLRRAINVTKDAYPMTAKWLKSLRTQNKYVYNPYKTVVESITEMCKHYDKASHSGLRDFYDNVKVKCKDAKEYDNMYSHNTWKPSEEQMKALHDLNLTGNISYAGQGQVLIELYNDLKKLAEE